MLRYFCRSRNHNSSSHTSECHLFQLVRGNCSNRFERNRHHRLRIHSLVQKSIAGLVRCRVWILCSVRKPSCKLYYFSASTIKRCDGLAVKRKTHKGSKKKAKRIAKRRTKAKKKKEASSREPTTIPEPMPQAEATAAPTAESQPPVESPPAEPQAASSETG